MTDEEPKTRNAFRAKQASTKKQRTTRIVILVLAIQLPLLMLVDFSPVGGKNILLYSRAIKCGEWPMEAVQHLSFGAGGLEYVPARPFMPIRLGDLNAYCNEKELHCMMSLDSIYSGGDCTATYEKYNVKPTYINNHLNADKDHDD